jgi:hypothetical protein
MLHVMGLQGRLTNMISKPQILNIARLLAGLCVSAGLIYFAYSKNYFVITVLIGLAIMCFSIFSRRPAAVLGTPYIKALASVGGRKPLRDLAKAVVCFSATIAVTIGLAIGVKHNVIPDNNLVGAAWLVLMVGGVIAAVVFLFRALIPIMYGSRRD